ncbi:glycosyl transferase family 2 [Candidatus Poribacteria bacterium]|nr:MAG: glycosyl transferase family 2 [Candidatus Poribacteria bacterium]
MKLSVLMPVYNERKTLAEIVSRVLNQTINGIDSLELVIVDDASTDGSTEILEQLAKTHQQIKPIFQKKNRGKGAVIRAAIEVASGDIAIIQDADLEYDPNDFRVVLTPILQGNADVVYGSRFMIKKDGRDLFSKHAWGNRFLTFLSNRFTNLNLTDMETCYKAFRLHSLKTIPLRSNRFGIEPEITAKIAKRKLRFHEVPISYHARTYAEGKKIKWKDGIVAIYIILKYWIIDDSLKKD